MCIEVWMCDWQRPDLLQVVEGVRRFVFVLVDGLLYGWMDVHEHMGTRLTDTRFSQSLHVV